MASNNIHKTNGHTHLERLLKRKGIAHTDICRAVGISKSQFYRICQNYGTYLTIQNLYKLSGVLGISAIEMLYTLERSRECGPLESEALHKKCEDFINNIDTMDVL